MRNLVRGTRFRDVKCYVVDDIASARQLLVVDVFDLQRNTTMLALDEFADEGALLDALTGRFRALERRKAPPTEVGGAK
jgi:hypothetical protein